ncbi:MAG: Rid family hydrolase [Pseudomonadota bacterium]
MLQNEDTGDQQPGWPGAHPHAVEVSGVNTWLAICSQVPVAPDGALSNGFATQAAQARRNAEVQLNAADKTRENLWRTTIYLSDHAYRAKSSVFRRDIMGIADTSLIVIVADIFDENLPLETDVLAAA